MNYLFESLFGAISLAQLIPIVAIAGGLLVASIAIIGGLLTAHRRQQMWHETARIALEKGQPLPPMPDDEELESKPAERGGDIRVGLILIAVGAGLYVFLGQLVSRNLGYVGAIPGFIGIALLLFGLLNLFLHRNDPPSSGRP